MAIHDISRLISPATAVWPEDRGVEWTWTACLGGNSPVNVGHICMSTHTATHVDAPLHVHNDGVAADELSLSPMVGPAQVVDLGDVDRLRPEQLPSPPEAPRLLLKTSASELSDDEWPSRIAPLAPSAVRHLDEHDIQLLGVDTPSVDPLESADLPAHHALRRAGLVHLEGLCLQDVPAGLYILVALPLRIRGADAAPVRAVLTDTPNTFFRDLRGK